MFGKKKPAPGMYDPDKDPLIQRARRRGPRRIRPFLFMAMVLGAIFFYYEGLPRLQGKLPQKETTGPTMLAGSSLANPGSGSEGPYRFRWVPNQRRYLGVSAKIQGEGNPSLTGDNGLDMGFDADFYFASGQQDADGNTELQLSFGDVNLYGNHFGRPVQMIRKAGVTQSYTDPVAAVPTALNQKFNPPDPASFDALVTGVLSPNGEIVKVGEESAHSVFFDSILPLLGTAFPHPNLAVGDTWQKEVDVKFPGMKAVLPVRVTSTLVGEPSYSGRRCGEIHQLIESTGPPKNQGPIAKVVGKVTQGNLASLVVSGTTRTYFDLDYGLIVYSEGDLHFNANLGGGLEAASDMLGIYSGMLEEVEGGQSFDFDQAMDSDAEQRPGIHVQVVIGSK